MESAPTCQGLARYGHAQELGVLIAAVANMGAEVAEILEARDNCFGGRFDELQRTVVAEDRMSTRALV